MISDSAVRLVAQAGRKAVYDAEHFSTRTGRTRVPQRCTLRAAEEAGHPGAGAQRHQRQIDTRFVEEAAAAVRSLLQRW